MGLLTVDVREVPIKQTPESSRLRWFVDVRCRGFNEVWSESNWDNERDARNAATIIRTNPHRYIGHFVGAQYLGLANSPGDRVFWVSYDNKIHVGHFVEYDNGTAIVKDDNGKEHAVRCR